MNSISTSMLLEKGIRNSIRESARREFTLFAFGLWAQHLRQGPDGSEGQARFEVLEAEMGNLRRELSELQERLDFAERVLAQGPESRRVGPEGQGPR